MRIYTTQQLTEYLSTLNDYNIAYSKKERVKLFIVHKLLFVVDKTIDEFGQQKNKNMVANTLSPIFASAVYLRENGELYFRQYTENGTWKKYAVKDKGGMCNIFKKNYAYFTSEQEALEYIGVFDKTHVVQRIDKLNETLKNCENEINHLEKIRKKAQKEYNKLVKF